MRVATINFYAGNRQPEKDCHFIESLKFDVIGMQEAHNRNAMIRQILGENYFVYGHVQKNGTRGSLENLAFLRKGVGISPKGHGSYKVAPAATPIKYCPERFLVWVRFTTANGKKRCLITTHTQPAVQSHSDGKMLPRSVKRVAGYVLGIRAIAKEVRKQRKAGWEPIVTGDLNYRRYPGVRNFVLAFYSPQRTFQRLKLAWREHAVDYVAWSSKMQYKNEGTISQSRHGADHDWLWVDLAND